ncbi:facilitated trehalose transporter Tret1-like isoform X2 [Homarus americanus]|uniref:facilitated trehalose transporter Tret1-like isoform X2 n=1 Tax=Homarus americanus TaxID=6706 RepID=UPI001C48D83D|nr:facilitated trehalose transporter Tret1-like isoform X2 [Homarus americanus]
MDSTPTETITLNTEGTSRGEEPARERRQRLEKQVLLTILASVTFVAQGTTQTWPSPALYDLENNNQTLYSTTITLTPREKDMTGSLWFLGSLGGSWAAGWAASKCGRRRSIQLLALPNVLGWLLVALAPIPSLMLTGRFVLGVASGAGTVCLTVYILEIADTGVRGTLSVIPTLALIAGGQYALWLGTTLHWYHLSFACTLPPLLLLGIYYILPDTPSYLFICGRYGEAAATLRKLRGRYADIESEMEDMKRSNESYRKNSGYRELLKVKVVKRIAVVMILFVFQQFCGNFVMIVYTARVLQAAGTPLEPDTASGIVMWARVAGIIMSFCLLDRLGRRNCLAASHAINAAALTLLGTYVYLNQHDEQQSPETSLSWVPMVCVATALFGSDIGLHSVPFILAAEYFPTNIRTHLYTLMQEALTQAGLYWFYAGSSLLATGFTFLAVTETMGKSMG